MKERQRRTKTPGVRDIERTHATIRWATAALALVLAIGCGPSQAPADSEASGGSEESGPTLLPIVAKSIEFHGGDLYEHSAVSLTISSLSGSFQIVSRRQGPGFDYTVTGTAGRDQVERRTHYTNDTLEQWDYGEAVELDEETARRARAYVDARVFFPFLPYTLKGGDVHFEDQGLETWDDRELQRVKVTFTPDTSNDADDAYLFWFDPDTGRLEQIGYDFNGGIRFRKATSFTRVGGILFSTQENYAVDGDRVPVDTLTPEYVAEAMELLSIVELSDIEVTPL